MILEQPGETITKLVMPQSNTVADPEGAQGLAWIPPRSLNIP